MGVSVTVAIHRRTLLTKSAPPSTRDTGKIKLIHVGLAAWNANPIIRSTYGNWAPIIDPDTHTPLEAWQPHGSVKRLENHYHHIHIELKQQTLGNTP
jgi:hypothetical protein